MPKSWEGQQSKGQDLQQPTWEGKDQTGRPQALEMPRRVSGRGVLGSRSGSDLTVTRSNRLANTVTIISYCEHERSDQLYENETSESCVMARDAVGSATARAELPSQRAHILAPRVALLPASPAKWLAEKNQRDQAVFGVPAHLWQVHGQLYDLTAYLSRHPGGREWLEMTRGSDVTVFFETHHLNQAKACAVLQQYRVDRSTPPPATSSDASADAYEWQPDGFYCTLRDRVRATLQQNGTSEAPTAVMLAYCYTFVALWFLGLFGTLFWCSWALSVVTGLLTLPVMGIGHNFMHKRNHILRYTFDLTCFGHHQWRISHVLSHHSYPVCDIIGQ
ncbi:uncharacterized protein MONBRDRAFT_8801 [Monosiga brevicollis MX1]|uniref:Cytochrome b5 heme-binding domain-containing protein n=1 Tax=Monosiga brevicollis TaxID=81824 RepID=A9V161_MONBE|nr:uncharacterized protein MONBRDRAFT_8801 [Monosiga brevicollis MX1]EDQ88752.1 predicted protein [Monosiga brevicollis MX1]|eukprot:XP_001746365.1 hypothetical protein [Monosiga brevicollis MX1]